MRTFTKNFQPDQFIVILVLGFYLVFQFPFLHLDFWNDEIYTLKQFTFVSPVQTVTDYHAPNNHVLFNLINNFYLKLIGEKNLYSLMDHPWVLRILSLLYSLGTFFFTFKCARKMSGKTAGVLSVILLCTTIPYYNFGAQVRGYSLGTFLLTALTYCLFSFLDLPKRSLFLWMIVLVAALVYTIPLNLYPVAGILVFLFVMIVATTIQSKLRKEKLTDNPLLKRYTTSVAIMITGVLLSLVFYSVIFHDVFFNEYVVPDPDFSSVKWLASSEHVFVFFFSYRDWLVPLILFGLCVRAYQLITGKNRKEFIFFFYLIIILVVPFFISFLRRDASPDRTYVNLIPLYAMFLAFLINGTCIVVSNRKLVITVTAGIALYCFVTVSMQMKTVSDRLLNDIQTSGRSHSIYYNYYLAHFRPLSVVRSFKESYYKDSSFVVVRDAEPFDLPEYLGKFQIPVRDFSLVDSVLMAGKKVFLFSRYPNEIESDVFRHQHACNVKMISEGVSYHNLFELEHVDLH